MISTEQPPEDVLEEEEKVEEKSNIKAVRKKTVEKRKTVLEESVRKMFLRWQQKTLEGRSGGAG